MENVKEKVSSDEVLASKYPEYKDITDEEAKDDFWRDLPEIEKYIINQITTEANGYGEDKLYINEYSRNNDEVNIQNYETLLGWDIACWDLQRKWRNEDEYSPSDIGEYVFNRGMTGEWIRFIEDSRLVYASLYSLHSFLWWKMEEIVLEIENEIIPHEYKWDPPLDKDDDCDKDNKCGDDCDCRRVNITINANGREEEYEKLRKLTYEYIAYDEKGDLIIKKLIEGYTGTFRVDNFENPDDPYSDLIVCDKETLREINPKTFLKNFKSFLNDNSLLDDLLAGLKIIIQQDYREYVKENM